MANYDHKHLVIGNPDSGVKGTYEIHDGENFSTNNPYGLYDVNLFTQTSREQAGVGNVVVDDVNKYGVDVTPPWSTQHNLVIHWLTLRSATGAGGCSNGYIHNKAYISAWFVDIDELVAQGQEVGIEGLKNFVNSDRGDGKTSSHMIYNADLTGADDKTGVDRVQSVVKGPESFDGTGYMDADRLNNNKRVSIWGGWTGVDHSWDIGAHQDGVTFSGDKGAWENYVFGEEGTWTGQNPDYENNDRVQYTGPMYRPQFNNLNIDGGTGAYRPSGMTGEDVNPHPTFFSVGNGSQDWLTNSTRDAFSETSGHFAIIIRTRGDRWKFASPTCQKSGRYGYYIIRIPKFWFVENQRQDISPASRVPLGVPGYCHYHNFGCSDLPNGEEDEYCRWVGNAYYRAYLDPASPWVYNHNADHYDLLKRGAQGLCANFINQERAYEKQLQGIDPDEPEGLQSNDPAVSEPAWEELYDVFNEIEMTDALYKRKLYSVTQNNIDDFMTGVKYDEYLSRGLLDEYGYEVNDADTDIKPFHRANNGTRSMLFDPAIKRMINDVTHLASPEGTITINGVDLYETSSQGGGDAGVMWNDMSLAFEIQSSAEPVYTTNEFPNTIWRNFNIIGFDPLQLCDWDTIRSQIYVGTQTYPVPFNTLHQTLTEDFEVASNVTITTEDAEYSVGRYYDDVNALEAVSAPASVSLNYEILNSSNTNDADAVVKNIDSEFASLGGMMARVVQWGDEQTLKSNGELVDGFSLINREDYDYVELENNNDVPERSFSHTYAEPGAYTIRALIFTYIDHPYIDNLQMAVKWKFVSTTVNIPQPGYMVEDFGQVGGYDFTTIPWNETAGVVGGISEDSGYIKSLRSLTRGAPFANEETPLLLNMREALGNDELGTHIGKADINTVRAYITGDLDLRRLHGRPPKPDAQVDGIPAFVRKTDAQKYGLLFVGLEGVHEHAATVRGTIKKVYMAGKDHSESTDEKQQQLFALYYPDGISAYPSNVDAYSSLMEVGIDSSRGGDEAATAILDINFEDITNNTVLDVSGRGNMGVFLGDYTIRKEELNQNASRDRGMKVGKQGKKDKAI